MSASRKAVESIKFTDRHQVHIKSKNSKTCESLKREIQAVEVAAQPAPKERSPHPSSFLSDLLFSCYRLFLLHLHFILLLVYLLHLLGDLVGLKVHHQVGLPVQHHDNDVHQLLMNDQYHYYHHFRPLGPFKLLLVHLLYLLGDLVGLQVHPHVGLLIDMHHLPNNNYHHHHLNSHIIPREAFLQLQAQYGNMFCISETLQKISEFKPNSTQKPWCWSQTPQKINFRGV